MCLKKYTFFIYLLFLSLASFSQNNGCVLLCNVDFEDQQVVAPGNYTLVNQGDVPCWNTTATDQIIEVWGTGFLGVPAYAGNQFIELNANQVSTIFQNFTATAGSTVSISFAHRGRNGMDVMSVEVGPVGGPYDNLGNFAAGNVNWNYNTVTYTFPPSPSSTYTIRFNSVSSAGGNIAIGNFLDAISIQLPIPVVNYTVIEPSCSLAADGEITLIPSGGTPPYSYTWTAPLTASTISVSGLTPGNYSVNMEDANGCSVFQNITLTPINQSLYDTISVEACEQFTWPVTNQTYTQSGLFSFNLLSNLGCDSLITMQLNILSPDSNYLSITSCDQYFWNNQWYTQSGVFEANYTNVNGCDSNVYLALTILSSDSILTQDTACGTYQWNSNTYTSSGLYTSNFFNQSGCDSTLYLLLTIHNADTMDLNWTACDAYTWNGNTFTQSGQYEYLTTNIHGCDSLTRLSLQINESSISSITDTVCLGDEIKIGNQTFNTTGNYTVVISNQQGCDSTVYLNLVIDSVGIKSFIFPNVFSPNADALNDVYFITGPLDKITQISLSIYNRWGNVVYQTSDPNFAWYPSSNELTSGVYFYTVEFSLACFSDQLLKQNGIISVFQ